MSNTGFWTLGKKMAVTIILAIFVWWLFGCSRPQKLAMEGDHDIDAIYLQRLYASYNEQYFGNRLTKTPKIDIENGGPDMADTWCDNEDGTGCHISFYMHYSAAPRVAQSVLLHEMCHVKTWSKSLDKDRPVMVELQTFAHGTPWRSCMLGLDAEGAFREINIDFYTEKVR